MFSLLLIDDTHRSLEELSGELRVKLNGEAEIRTWEPKDELNALAFFESLIDIDTLLVVTDYDLTSQGQIGFFGSSVVGWCQSKTIPVGDYSRGNHNSLPKEPNLFELRIPTDTGAAEYIASVYRGFKWIREHLAKSSDLLEKGSPFAVMAELLGVPEIESQFSMYGGRLGTSSGVLVDRITRTGSNDPDVNEKRSMLCYIIGHLLLNSILRFPGPILSSNSLVSFVACDESEKPSLRELFTDAIYSGPFSELDDFFWLYKVDEILEQFCMDLPNDFKADTHGELYRSAIEAKLNRKLIRHRCSRCQGVNGGFLCPFTRRTVCQRDDCSIGSNSWVPRGARLCRIERDFYDEWAPILGI